MFLMLVGSAGIVTLIGTLVFSFAGAEPGERAIRLAVLIGGLLLVWLVARSGTVDRYLSRAIARFLHRFTDLDARDYAELLHLSEEYAIMEIGVQPGDWVADRTLGELSLRDEGIVVDPHMLAAFLEPAAGLLSGVRFYGRTRLDNQPVEALVLGR